MSEGQDEYVRVLRLVEYAGPRWAVEAQVTRSIHGTKDLTEHNGMTITVVTVGEFPTLLRDYKEKKKNG